MGTFLEHVISALSYLQIVTCMGHCLQWIFLLFSPMIIFVQIISAGAYLPAHLRTVPTNSKIFLPRFMIMQEM